MDQLKFVVLDEEDLEVASTHLQDAVAKVAMCTGGRRKNAWCWRSIVSTGKAPNRPSRNTAGGAAALRIERVLSCKCRDVNPAGQDDVLNLLAVEFAETNAPSGRGDHQLFGRGDPAAGGRVPGSRIGRSRAGLEHGGPSGP